MSKTILLNQNWIFSKEGHDEPVTLPHTWNAIDGQDGGTRRTVEYALRSGLEVVYVDAE